MQSGSYAGAIGGPTYFCAKLCTLAEIRFAMFTPRLAIFFLASILRLIHVCGVKAGFAFDRQVAARWCLGAKSAVSRLLQHDRKLKLKLGIKLLIVLLLSFTMHSSSLSDINSIESGSEHPTSYPL